MNLNFQFRPDRNFVRKLERTPTAADIVENRRLFKGKREGQSKNEACKECQGAGRISLSAKEPG